MTYAFNQAGFETSILNSDDDFEPYGFVAPQLASAGFEHQPGRTGFGTHHRVIEAAVLRGLEKLA
ncbi:MAG: hypothetical protein U9Q81_27485 [Pseudomonadota bacterium]|nr:hypothetical protein [Pseudomonadota bacterium]